MPLQLHQQQQQEDYFYNSNNPSSQIFSAIECTPGCKVSSINITNVSGYNNSSSNNISPTTTTSMDETEFVRRLTAASTQQKPTSLLALYPDALTLAQARGTAILDTMKQILQMTNKISSSSSHQDDKQHKNFLHTVATALASSSSSSSASIIDAFKHELFIDNKDNNNPILATWVMFALLSRKVSKKKRIINNENEWIQILQICNEKLKKLVATTVEKENKNEEDSATIKTFQIKTTREVEFVADCEWWCKIFMAKAPSSSLSSTCCSSSYETSILSTTAKLERLNTAGVDVDDNTNQQKAR